MLSTQRDVTLDIAKGVSILLMTISHLVLFLNYPILRRFNVEVLMIFKMPLFIFISGILFTNKLPLKAFTIKKWKGLVKPTVNVVFFVTLLLLFFFTVVQGQSLTFEFLQDLYRKILDSFIGLWFPLSLFVSVILFKLLLDIKNRYAKTTYLGALLLLFASLFFLQQHNIGVFLLKANTWIFFVLILAMGYYFKRSGYANIIYRPAFFIGSLVVFTVLSYFSVPLHVKVDLYLNKFGRLSTTIPAFLSGIACLLFISRQISKLPYISAIFVSCSRASFFILAFHGIIGNNILYKLFSKFLPQSLYIDIFAFIATIFFCIVAYKITTKVKILKRFLLP